MRDWWFGCQLTNFKLTMIFDDGLTKMSNSKSSFKVENRREVIKVPDVSDAPSLRRSRGVSRYWRGVYVKRG